MSVTDLVLLVVRWVHGVAAVAWIGGGLFYLLVLRPALKREPQGAGLVNAAVAREFRALVDVCLFLLAATGALLAVSRLTGGVAGLDYGVTLGVKVFLSVWMFALVRRGRRRLAGDSGPEDAGRGLRLLRGANRYTLVLVLGLVVYLLSDLMKVLYELALAR